MHPFVEILCIIVMEEDYLHIYIYPNKYLDEPLLPNDYLLDNTILLICTLLTLIDFSYI